MHWLFSIVYIQQIRHVSQSPSMSRSYSTESPCKWPVGVLELRALAIHYLLQHSCWCASQCRKDKSPSSSTHLLQSKPSKWPLQNTYRHYCLTYSTIITCLISIYIYISLDYVFFSKFLTERKCFFGWQGWPWN
jgi:hypothetical protein